MKAEAKYNVTTEFPHLGLHSAAATGNIGLVKYALSHGQPINSVIDGILPLHAACFGGSDLVVKLLIEHGADVNAPRLPRRYSTEKNRDALALIVGSTGSTPLHFAAANGHTVVISTLLLNGAYPDRADKHGFTPEMLARQNGWLECAETLRAWILKEEKSAKGAPSFGEEGSSRMEWLASAGNLALLNGDRLTRRRLLVKRSMDHALNTLKSSINNRSESHLLRTTNALPVPSLPPSKSLEGYVLHPTSVRSTDDLSSRCPSISIHESLSWSASHRSLRRPQSAGGPARSEEEMNISRRKLGSKYSLLNMFKRASESTTPDSDAISFGAASNPLLHVPPSSPPFDSSSFITRLPNGIDSNPPHSPSRPNYGGEHTRDGSISSISRNMPVFEDDECASPIEIPGPSQRSLSDDSSHHESTIAQPSFRALRFNSTPSKAVFPGHWTGRNRAEVMSSSSSSPAGALRNRSFSASKTGAITGVDSDLSIPESAPITQEGPKETVHDDVEENVDETSGELEPGIERPKLENIQMNRARASSFTSSSSSLSPITNLEPGTDQWYSSNDVENSIKGPSSPPPRKHRFRGESVSSVSTDSSMDANLMSDTTATSNDSKIPSPSPSYHLSPISIHSATMQSNGFSRNVVPSSEFHPNSLSKRRAHAPLDINIRSISSHAQAEALVQQTQQSILQMVDELDGDQSNGIGQSSLSAKLAAYGESLALERMLKEEEENRANSHLKPESPPGTRARLDRLLSKGTPGTTGNLVTLERQRSLEQRFKVERRPRRPNTGGAEYLSPNPTTSNLSNRQLLYQNSSTTYSRPHHVTRSFADNDALPSSNPPPPNTILSPASEPNHAQTNVDDSIEDLLLSPVSPASIPESVDGLNERYTVPSKLSRMGFAATDGWPSPPHQSSGTLSRSSGSKPKFGLMSLVHSLKGKS